MRPSTLLASTVLASLLLLAGRASAQSYPPPGPPPGPPPNGGYPPPRGGAPIGWYPEQHDHEGFFARVYLGPAYLTSTIDHEVFGKGTASGGGAALGLAAGWALNPNLVLYGELFADAVAGPTFEHDGVSMTQNENTSFGVGGLGVGAAYYFEPSNFFVSGTLAFSSISADDDTTDNVDAESTDLGPGISVMGGKEWWIARNTALGVAGQFFFGTEPNKDGTGTWNTTAFGVVVTASYN